MLQPKMVDDVLGGADAWKNADQTDGTRGPPPGRPARSPRACTLTSRASVRRAAVCPRCRHHRAYFQQLQIRSADEPMTTFLKCVSCGVRWRED